MDLTDYHAKYFAYELTKRCSSDNVEKLDGALVAVHLGLWAEVISMKALKRITFNPAVMGGRPCIRGLRVTVGTVVGLLASGHSREEILKLYPYLESEDIDEALAYAAWRVEEAELPLETT